MQANRHYILDAYGCFSEQADNIMIINDLLIQLAEELGMGAVMPPFIIPYYYCDDPQDVGISAFCICRGGAHITIHTFPERSCYFVDILTDNYFEEADVTHMIGKQIYASNMNSRVIDRRIFDGEQPGIDKAYDFGPHYMISVRDLDVTFEDIFKWLDTIAEKINMVPISRPYVIYDKVEKPDYISGMLVVAQSHIAFHYCISQREANLDIFSCSFLDAEVIDTIMGQCFNGKVEMNLLARGSKYKIECQHRSRQAKIDKCKKWRNHI